MISYLERKALKGKLVTRMQYRNWMTPERMRNARKASMNSSLEGVTSMYAVQKDYRAKDDGEVGAGLGTEGACFHVFDDNLGPAIWILVQYTVTVIRLCVTAVSWVLPTTRRVSDRDWDSDSPRVALCIVSYAASQEQAHRRYGLRGYPRVHRVVSLRHSLQQQH